MTTLSAGGTPSPRIKRILIAVDLSSVSARAAAYVRYLAAPGAQVRVVSVAENPRTLLPLGSLTDAALQTARAELLRDASEAAAHAKEAFANGNGAVEADVIELSRHGGYTANALIDAATEWKADLLVVGARQHRGILRWVEGTVSESVTTQTPCSILVVPASYDAEIPEFPRRILFALDGSPASLDAMQFGLQLATPEAHLRAVYVIDRAVRLTDFVPIHVLEDAFIEEGKTALANAAGVFANLSNHVETGLLRTKPTSDDVPHTIVREAERWHADLVVVGTHGRRGLARWFLGSVAARTARIAQTPLLLARPRPDSSA
ncbi:universal stress protein [Paraburkholderia terricola]|uniref:Nucleotide-binding universal stress protein, UspA family n=1 Tax=Paraburkholderia terricola TaxID=169427 RepID=A0A1M6R0F6_9BURK|nr:MULTISPECIES: universal stress protein [Paraburkholderia]SDO43280.1 Nucleotide-binding universal stress protein, UspA family [Paraburkholderia sediminicola]SHK25914.1 Nucleotide-binding universal stress protein, UspA family [Paraburkholderia terricola]